MEYWWRNFAGPPLSSHATRKVLCVWGVWGLLLNGVELINEASRITIVNTLHYEDHENIINQYLTSIAALLFFNRLESLPGWSMQPVISNGWKHGRICQPSRWLAVLCALEPQFSANLQSFPARANQQHRLSHRFWGNYLDCHQLSESIFWNVIPTRLHVLRNHVLHEGMAEIFGPCDCWKKPIPGCVWVISYCEQLWQPRAPRGSIINACRLPGHSLCNETSTLSNRCARISVLHRIRVARPTCST